MFTNVGARVNEWIDVIYILTSRAHLCHSWIHSLTQFIFKQSLCSLQTLFNNAIRTKYLRINNLLHRLNPCSSKWNYQHFWCNFSRIIMMVLLLSSLWPISFSYWGLFWMTTLNLKQSDWMRHCTPNALSMGSESWSKSRTFTILAFL